MPRHSLRASLLAGLVGLTAVALLLVGAAGVVTLRAYLLHETDEQLAVAAALARRRTALPAGDAAPGTALRSAMAVTQYLIEFRRPDGTVVRLLADTPLPARPLLAAADPDDSRPQTVEVDSGARYRVVVVDSDGITVLVGLPLAPVRDTVNRLALVSASTSATVLTLLSLLAWLLVRRRLRPLDEIAATATALAEGDLNRRVPAPPPGGPAARTEVGRLTLAINGMLGRIQVALAARARSEQKMREFVADASHELRTPVTSINGYLQLIRTGVVDPRDRPDVLRRLEEESARMGALVNGLLYLARLDVDPPTRQERFDLVAVTRDAAADARAVEPDRPITVDSPDRCPVLGDVDTLRQVLANLLGNVRAHTPPGTPATITITATDTRVRLAVADAGPGMTEQAAAHAFDRFWRADTSRSATGGAGLGLAIVAEAVRAHGGDVRLTSAPGQGTTVTVDLPALSR